MVCEQKRLELWKTSQHFIEKQAAGPPRHTRSEMCESQLGILPITADSTAVFVTYLDKRIFITPTISYLSKPDVKQLYSRYLMKYNMYPALTCCSTVQVGVSSQSAVEISCESLRNFVSLRLKAEALDVFRFNILCAGKPLKLLLDIHRWEP